MKAIIDIKKDKSEARIHVIEGYEMKEVLKARGYRYAPGEILDYSTNKMVNGWEKEIPYSNARDEMSWLTSNGIKPEQGIVY